MKTKKIKQIVLAVVMTAFGATSFADEPVKTDPPQLGASIYETLSASNSFARPRYRSNYRSGGENTLSVVAGVDFGCYKSFPYNGVYVGALYNIMLSDAFGIEPGLELRWLMNKNYGEYHEVGWFVPVMANYSFEVGDEFYLSFFAGPTLDLTMVSVVEFWGTKNSTWFGDGCCDLLLGAGVGAKYRNFGLRVAYNYGVVSHAKALSGHFNIGLTYSF